MYGRGKLRMQQRLWGGQDPTYSQWCQVERGRRTTRCAFLQATSSGRAEEQKWREQEGGQQQRGWVGGSLMKGAAEVGFVENSLR